MEAIMAMAAVDGSYSSLVTYVDEEPDDAGENSEAGEGPFVLLDGGGFAEVPAVQHKWAERGEKAPSSDGFEGRGEEEMSAVWVVRRHLTGPKQSTHGYMCRFCQRLYQGGPQIIRAHITGQAQGKNGGVRSKACSAPPEELKENWLRPELSKSEKEQQKVDRADAKKLKQQHKAVAGVAGAGRAASSKKNKLQHDSDDVLLTLEVNMIEVACNRGDEIRRFRVAEGVTLAELHQRLTDEYSTPLDIRYKDDDGQFQPMTSEHHLSLAKALASQAGQSLLLALCARGAGDFSTLGLEDNGGANPYVSSRIANKRRRVEHVDEELTVGISLAALVESA